MRITDPQEPGLPEHRPKVYSLIVPPGLPIIQTTLAPDYSGSQRCLPTSPTAGTAGDRGQNRDNKEEKYYYMIVSKNSNSHIKIVLSQQS